MNRRCVVIAPDLLDGPLGLFVAGRSHPAFRIAAGIPDGARFVDADTHPATGVLRLWFEHESFDNDARAIEVRVECATAEAAP